MSSRDAPRGPAPPPPPGSAPATEAGPSSGPLAATVSATLSATLSAPLPPPLATDLPAGLAPHLPPPKPEACFDAGWLALRRAADSAARARELERCAADWLRQRRIGAPQDRPLRVVDLGCGSGANPCHLATRLPGPQQWTLIDHDPGLLAHAHAACAGLRDAAGEPARVATRCQDLARLDAHALAGTDLVCASALLDLVDAAWLDRLADACAATGSALLVTLSVDGHWCFRPDTADGPTDAVPGPADRSVDPATDAAPEAAAAAPADDSFVRAAFNAHQRRDKGLGAALGPDAAPALATRLRARGFAVQLAPSPWRLALADPAQADLARALIDGWRDAASAQRPDASARIAAWHARRIAACGPGGGTLEVGHVDLFATPPTRHLTRPPSGA